MPGSDSSLVLVTTKSERLEAEQVSRKCEAWVRRIRRNNSQEAAWERLYTRWDAKGQLLISRM